MNDDIASVLDERNTEYQCTHTYIQLIFIYTVVWRRRKTSQFEFTFTPNFANNIRRARDQTHDVFSHTLTHTHTVKSNEANQHQQTATTRQCERGAARGKKRGGRRTNIHANRSDRLGDRCSLSACTQKEPAACNTRVRVCGSVCMRVEL